MMVPPCERDAAMKRMTNGFGKKLANLKAAVALFVTWYNFCRVFRRCAFAPAMEAKLD
jgi:hypothetical protein